MIYHLPNILSTLRVILAPVFFYMLISGSSDLIIASCIIYLVAALTDYFDGWFARKFKAMSTLGRFLDPLADKVLTSLALIAFVILKIIPLWMVLIILIRDFGTTILRIYTDSQNVPMMTSNSAKYKTFFQMLFIGFILTIILIYNLNIGLDYNLYHSLLYNIYIEIMMLLLVIFTVWTFIEYLVKNKIIKIWK